MKQVKILGTGCPKCEKLAEAVAAVLAGTSEPYEIEKVTKIEEIIGYGVMMTPALVVDGEVKVVGKVPAPDELRALLG
ncbi:MAG: thioredoxin family protein [Candidatus Krumholzibacteriota bacterium]|nr:thioredoxin family protein [Candidatus Krumholzibacteriota bacterium]